MSNMQSRHEETFNHMLKEPLLHFFILAMIVFVGYEVAKNEDEFLLEISQVDIDARISLLELKGRDSEASSRCNQLP